MKSKVTRGVKMNVKAGGFLNFMKENRIYLDRNIFIKYIMDNKTGNNVNFEFYFF